MRSSGLACVVVLAVVGCHKPKQIVAEDAGIVPVAAAVAAPVEEPRTPAQFVSMRMGGIASYTDAVDAARSMMEDTIDRDNTGAKVLALWESSHALWKDVAPASDETTFARFMKDPDAERTKRLCAPGSLVEIAVDRSGGAPVAVGLMRTDAGNLLRFLAVGSSGDLVGDSYTRICGTATGRYDYHNSGGGVGHAVQIVGMFDLPVNRGRKLITPAPVMAGLSATKL